MKLQILVSAVNAEVFSLAEKMNLQADAVIINQCAENRYDEYNWKGSLIRCYSFAERGVGLSRNSALMRADGDICLFADEDIVYKDGAAAAILREFEEHREADMLLFNMEVTAERATYHTAEFGRVRWYNCGRYPTYSFAARTEKLHRANMSFSLLYGGGAKYSNGEDSLFLAECIRKRLKVYRTPVEIGREVPRPSTWFEGYNDKFFYDRGVLYHDLYARLAFPMAIRFLLAHRGEMCREIPFSKALEIMRRGIRLEEMAFDGRKRGTRP